MRFRDLRDVGDPVELGAAYSDAGADELVFLDIQATTGDRPTFVELVKRVAERLAIPFTVGGGVRSADDAERLLQAGADKVAVNSAALARPPLVGELADRLGSQAVVVAIDAAGGGAAGSYALNVWLAASMYTYEYAAGASHCASVGAGKPATVLHSHG